MYVKWKFVSVRFEIVLVLAQDWCTVCTECTSGTKIILGTDKNPLGFMDDLSMRGVR